jgi:Arc/MetJ-type ribon-helix-helix transcriptional regulator
MDQAIDTAVEGGLWTDRSEFIRGAIRQQLQREFRGDDS